MFQMSTSRFVHFRPKKVKLSNISQQRRNNIKKELCLSELTTSWIYLVTLWRGPTHRLVIIMSHRISHRDILPQNVVSIIKRTKSHICHISVLRETTTKSHISHTLKKALHYFHISKSTFYPVLFIHCIFIFTTYLLLYNLWLMSQFCVKPS